MALNMTVVNLKAIVLGHWVLTVWACMGGAIQWLPSSYQWCNFTVLAVGVWAVAQKDSVDAIFMFLAGMTISILLDIIHFGIYYGRSIQNQNAQPSVRDEFRFAVGMAILNLILKPFTCLLLYQMYRERGGEMYMNFDAAQERYGPLDSSTEIPPPPQPVPPPPQQKGPSYMYQDVP
ncbi:hypothetical protein Bbelb_325840 [Branchiostoma belcheri]|nr:hypothetical protein Bbelb_325840 [Branchiostoma belcheri]